MASKDCSPESQTFFIFMENLTENLFYFFAGVLVGICIMLFFFNPNRKSTSKKAKIDYEIKIVNGKSDTTYIYKFEK